MAKANRKPDKEGMTLGAMTCLALAAFALYGGLHPLFSDRVPRCGSAVMTPGTVCKHKGSTTSYAEAKAYAEAPWDTSNTVWTVIGILLVVAAMYFVWRRIRASRV